MPRGNVTKGALLHQLVERVAVLEEKVRQLEQPAAAAAALEEPPAPPAPTAPPVKRTRAKKSTKQ